MNGQRHGMDERDPMDGAQFDEQLLRRALQPLRPDPEAFLRGVRERIARGEREGAPQAAPSPWLRSAAALLPPGLVRDELLGATLGVAGKSGVGGFAGAVLIAPALALMAVLVMFWLSLRRVVSARARHAGVESTNGANDLAALARYGQGGWGLALGAVFLATWFLLPTLTLGVLALSMAGLSVVLVRLARRGLTSRLVVGTLCGQLLFWLAVVGLQFVQFHPDGSLASVPPALFALGAIGCHAQALFANRRSGRGSQSRSWAPAAYASLNTVLALCLLAFLVPGALRQPADRADLVRYVERFDAGSRSPHWKNWSLVAAQLLRDGGARPNLEPVARALHARLDSGASVDPYTLRWAARTELLRPTDWEALHDPASFERLVRGTGRIPFLAQYVTPIRAAARVGELDGERRALIVARLLASIPSEPVHAGVCEALAAVEALEALGATDAIVQGADAIHTQLQAAWAMAASSRTPIGFSEMVETELLSTASFFYTDPTFEALELIARFGLPEGIDPRRIRRFLEEAARGPMLPTPRRPHELVAAAALRRLAELDLQTAPDAAEWLKRLRILVPAALLALFCLIATALAPARPGIGS